MFNIGLGLALNGETEFKRGIKEVNNELKVLKSEMKLTKEQYANSANSLEALTKKNELLERQLEQTNKKLSLNQDQLDKWRDVHEKARGNIEELKDQIAKEAEQMEKMQKSAGTSSEELKKQQDRIDDLNQELQNAENAYDKAGEKIVLYQTRTNNTKAEIERLNREVQDNGRYMDEARNSTDQCATSIDEYGKKAQEAANESENLSSTGANAMDNLATAIQAAGVIEAVDDIKNALMDCADTAAQFETATKKLSTIAEGTGVSIETLRRQSLNASSKLAQDADNIAEASYNAISAGVSAEKSVYAASQASELAISGFTTPDAALSVLTTAVNAYKKDVDEMTQISDSLIVTQNLGVLTVDQLAQSMGKGIASASAYNVDLYNLESGYISLTKNGIGVAESTTYMSSMFKELGDSGSTVSNIMQEKTGYTFGQLMGQGATLADVLDILYQSVDGDAEAMMNLWSSAEAGKAANAIISQGLDTFNQNLITVENSTGATASAFEKMSNSTEFAEEKMSVSARNLKIAVGTELNKAFKNVYDTGADVMDHVTEFVEQNPEIVGAVGALAGGVGAVTVGIMAWTAAQKILNTVLASNPYALVVIAIAGVTSAIAGYMAACEEEYGWATKIKEAENEKQKAIQETLDTLKDSLEQRDESRKSHEQEIGVIQTLSAEMVNLQKKENLTSEEQKRMSMIVTELNEAVPDLNLALDEQGKVIGYTADELERYCEMSLRSLELQFKQEDMTEVAKDHYEAEKKLTEIQKNRVDLEDQLADMQEEYAQYVKDHQDEINYQDRKWTNAEENARRYKDAIATLEDEIGDYNTQERECRGIIIDLEGQYAELTGEVMDAKNAYNETEGAVSNLQETIIEYKGQHYSISQNVAADLNGIRDEYQKAKIDAEESIKKQVGLFEELETASDMSAQKMADNLESQAEFYNQYAENIEIAKQIMQDANDDAASLISAVLDEGMSGAGELDTIIQAYKEGGEEFNNVVSQYAEMREARENLAGAMADMNTSYTEGTEQMMETALENGEAMRVTTAEMGEKMQSELAASMDTMNTNTQDGFDTINKTIADSTQDAELNSSALGQAMISAMATTLQIDEEGKAYAFTTQGEAITAGIASGIDNGKDTIAAALQGAIDYSAKYMNYASLSNAVVGAVNVALGQQMK